MDDSTQEMPQKMIILGSNERDRSIAAVPSNNTSNGLRTISERRKSVVASNIGSCITANY